MDKRKTSSRILKHPVLKNVEYASIKRKGKAVLEIQGNDLNNVAWRDFQIYVGKKIGVGSFAFTMKFKNNAELYTGRSNAVDLDLSVAKSDDSDLMISQMQTSFKSLESKLDNATQSGGITFEMLIDSTKRGYDTQVDFLKQQIVYKVEIISELRIEIKDLNKELEKTDITIRQLEIKTGYGQYLEPLTKVLIQKFGAGKPIKLGESDPSLIPDELLQVLGVIDYTKIQPEHLNKMISLLRDYIVVTKLPLKGQ